MDDSVHIQESETPLRDRRFVYTAAGVSEPVLIQVPHGHRDYMLINGDSLNVSSIPQSSVDLIITSPPYNVGMAYQDTDDTIDYEAYLGFSQTWLENCYTWSKPGGRLCVNVSLDKNKQGKAPLSADITRTAMEAGWRYHATIIWNEGNISRRTAWGSWKSASAPHVIAAVETVIVLYKDYWRRGKQGTSTISGDDFKEWVRGVWTFPGESARRIGHEAPFPRELPKRCIQLFSFMEDTVLDPFNGSGTTMIEAIESGRSAMGIDLSRAYCELAQKRILKECGVELVVSPSPKSMMK